jgi:hypothetical protein
MKLEPYDQGKNFRLIQRYVVAFGFCIPLHYQ